MSKIENERSFADNQSVLTPHRYVNIAGRWEAIFYTVTGDGGRGGQYYLHLADNNLASTRPADFRIVVLEQTAKGRATVYHGEKPLEDFRSVESAVRALAAVMERRGERVGLYEPAEPADGIERELRLARNYPGPLGEEHKKKLRAVYEQPSQDTWEQAHALMVYASPGCTLWQAVMAVDRHFPASKPHGEPWPEVPTRAVIREALGYATHEHARSMCDSITMADGQTSADMTLAPGYEIFPGNYGEVYVTRAGIRNAGAPNLYSAEEAALCGAAHFHNEEWGEMVTETYLEGSPGALEETIERRFADEARAALSQFAIPLKEYEMEVDAQACGNEVRASVDLTHHSTKATISVKDMRLALDTREVMTPSHPRSRGHGHAALSLKTWPRQPGREHGRRVARRLSRYGEHHLRRSKALRLRGRSWPDGHGHGHR